MGFTCGIVGLPNVGKSTLFNALTQTIKAQAENYPFCTIEPNSGVVAVPDERLETIGSITGSKEIIPTSIEIVDIAGLVEGAHKGEGLGNQFLSHIRQVDAIIHVVRCFDDKDIIHVAHHVDPVRDIQIIDTELMLADLETLERRKVSLEKKVRGQDKNAMALLGKINDCLGDLNKGIKPHSGLEELQLLTSKPVLYVCNTSEHAPNHYVDLVKDYVKGAPVIRLCAALESQLSALSLHDQKELLEGLGLNQKGLDQVLQQGYHLLNLITFFTSGPKETRAWTIAKQTKAPQAAGVIHTDFEKGFIRAEVMGYEDFVQNHGEQGAKNAGKMRLEGKDYIVCDGDIIHFRFNV